MVGKSEATENAVSSINSSNKAGTTLLASNEGNIAPNEPGMVTQEGVHEPNEAGIALTEDTIEEKEAALAIKEDALAWNDPVSETATCPLASAETNIAITKEATSVKKPVVATTAFTMATSELVGARAMRRNLFVVESPPWDSTSFVKL